MTIRQLSVFLENKPGYLNKVLKVLSEHGINIIALTIADTSEYGIVRLLLSHPQEALETLREQQFTVRMHDVLSLEMSPQPGALFRILECFTQTGIGMEYVYAFSFGNKAIVVFRTDNREKAIEVIKNNHLKSISEDDLK